MFLVSIFVKKYRFGPFIFIYLNFV